tara:strand:+ start:299 stop:676 length:378 start_codon:yes stop_codon:yes gene_type:complete
MTETAASTPVVDSTYLEYEAKQRYSTDVETARVRAWGYFLGAYLTGPIWPAVIASRTKVWAPFWAGLALGTLSLPLAIIDASIFSSIPAAGLGTYMMAEKSKEKRRKLNVVAPEHADVLKFQTFN